MKRILCLVTLVLSGSTLVLGNIARPEPTPNGKTVTSIDTQLSIRLDRRAKEARLIIPRSQLKQLRAELDALDEGNNTAVLAADPTGSSRIQTIVSGMFLSFAFIFGGIWLARSRQAGAQSAKGFMILTVMAAIGSATALVYANAGPPPEARSITGKMFSSALHSLGYGWGMIKLETGDGDRVQLIVPNPKTSGELQDEE